MRVSVPSVGVALVLAGCGRIGFDPLGEGAAGDGGGVEQQLTVAIAGNADDGEFCHTPGGAIPGGWSTVGERNFWIYMGSSTFAPTISYFRFQLPRAISGAATIASARLRLWSADSWEWNPGSDVVSIWIEDSPDAPVISGIDDSPRSGAGQARELMDVQVRWPSGGSLSWPLDQWHETEDAGPLLQSVIDRYGGLEAGAHIQIYVFSDASVNGEVAAEDSAAGRGHAPQLELSWIE